MGQQICKRHGFIPLCADDIDQEIILAEFPHNLAANAAGRECAGDYAILAAANRNGLKVTMSIVNSLKEGSALGAIGRAIGCVFNVAALVDRSIGTQQRRPHLIPGLGHIGMGHGLFCQFNKLFRCHYRISFAKLRPGVS